MTAGTPSVNCTIAPSADGVRPFASSSTPATRSSSLYRDIASSSSADGGSPSSLCSLDLTITMKRISSPPSRRSGLFAQPAFLLDDLGRRGVFLLYPGDPPDLDRHVAVAVHRRPALDPLDDLVQRRGLDDRVARDQLLGLGERAVDHGLGALADPPLRPARGGVQARAVQHHARLHELLVVLPHGVEQLGARQRAGPRLALRAPA